jgi:hypothetical protein
LISALPLGINPARRLAYKLAGVMCSRRVVLTVVLTQLSEAVIQNHEFRIGRLNPWPSSMQKSDASEWYACCKRFVRGKNWSGRFSVSDVSSDWRSFRGERQQFAALLPADRDRSDECGVVRAVRSCRLIAQHARSRYGGAANRRRSMAVSARAAVEGLRVGRRTTLIGRGGSSKARSTRTRLPSERCGSIR